jgi:2-oxoisovalerate dehydrogenase E1 component
MQWLHGAGAAEASLHFEQFPGALVQAQGSPLGHWVRHESDEVVLVSGGEGMTSEGEFFEALSTACIRHLPVIFLVEDNGYAISVPVELQAPGGKISKVVSGFSGLHIEECDGTDPLASYDAMRRATEYCRKRLGPALVHAHVTRPYSHSLSDDEKQYRPASELDAQTQHDAIPRFGRLLVTEGVVDEAELRALEAQIDQEVIAATDRALGAEPPSADSVLKWVYSPDVDPCSRAFETAPAFSGDVKTMVEIVPATIADEMARDERIVVFGEDVADCSREENLPEVKAKAASSRRPGVCRGDLARVAFSIRRWRKRILWVAPSAWPCAG